MHRMLFLWLDEANWHLAELTQPGLMLSYYQVKKERKKSLSDSVLMLLSPVDSGLARLILVWVS